MSPTLRTLLTRTVVAATFALTSAMSFADWQLDNAQSQLNFISVKKSAVVETHRFKTLSGSIDAAGKAQITINLSSVDTSIGIRDERLQKMLFETGLYPSAVLSAALEPALLDSLKPGESTSIDLSFELSLHGLTQSINAAVQVTALNHEQWMVTTIQPIVIKAADFNLLEGINQLRDIAGLPSITTAIPVTAQLVFKRS